MDCRIASPGHVGHERRHADGRLVGAIGAVAHRLGRRPGLCSQPPAPLCRRRRRPLVGRGQPTGKEDRSPTKYSDFDSWSVPMCHSVNFRHTPPHWPDWQSIIEFIRPATLASNTHQEYLSPPPGLSYPAEEQHRRNVRVRIE